MDLFYRQISLLFLLRTTAAASVTISVTKGANQMASVPKTNGRQKIISALTAMPRLTAMALAVPVRFVEKKYAVQMRFSAIGTNDSAKYGSAADAAPISSGSLLKTRMTGTSKKNSPPQISTDSARLMRSPLRKYQRICSVSFLP